MDADRRPAEHLSPGDLAAWFDGALTAAERLRVETHLADCDECRAEVVAASRLTRLVTPRRRWYLPAVAAAAAAVLLIVVARQPSGVTGPASTTREPAITTTVAPRVVAPRGAVSGTPAFLWSSVPHADRYRITLFDERGGSVWESQTRDTVAALPAGITLRRGASYFLRIEAQTGWNRWVASDLTEFTIAEPTR